MKRGGMGVAALACGLLMGVASGAYGCGDDGAVADLGGATDARAPDDGDAPRDGRPPTDGAPDDGCPPCSAAAPWACERCLPTPLQEVTAAILDGTVVIAGGFQAPTNVVTAVRRFDPATDEWTELPSLPAPRHHLSLVALGGDLYAVGGMETLAFEPVADGWVLRAGAGDWAPIAPLPIARAAAGAAAIDGRIVMAAGQGPGGGATAQLTAAAPALTYDPATDEWTQGAAIPTLREHVASFAHEGELWILGGRSVALEPTLDIVEVYDPATDQWRPGPTMPSPHGGFAAATLDGVAYVGGGEERDRALQTFEALDLATGDWSVRAPIPTPRHGHAMAGVAGRVFVIGGANEPIFAAVSTVESFTP